MRKTAFLAICLLAALAGPLDAQTTLTLPQVGGAIRELLSTSGLGGATVGVYVLDVRDGAVIADINSTAPVAPASCNKLFTTAAALSLLGPDYRFTTELYADGKIANGKLRGDLIVRGGGDPSISGRFETDKRDLTRQMRDWAELLRARGILRVTGRLVADDTIFDREYFHPSWYPKERGEWYEAEIWGLSFNDNCVDILWSGADLLPGDKARMTLNPAGSFAKITNAVKVIARGRTGSRYYLRTEKSNDILATGTIAVDFTKEDSASVHNCPLFYLSVFRDVLTSAGIVVDGKDTLITPSRAASYRNRALKLGARQSPPLGEIIKVVNLNSQNFYADMLAKTLGREKLGSGSFKAGCAVIRDFCRRNGLECATQKIDDGSGLSARNRTTARELAEVIRLIDQGSLRETWRASLPVGGQRGTLKSRFQETTETRAIAGRLWGKTGLIGGVRSLVGIARNDSGHEMYYAIVVNNFKSDASVVMKFIDSAALILARSRDD
ncbi:MAG: D-alanyl-D-alanine carboxypeptidase/D-alanyl-D-alanine-endopeptidase [Candidatus Sumerlaeota bacterium]|nr:D-alanyl-D-alanine carboxypeptidase/D-alanyl-D-alanine-endopeptidase [Candidatus Sumerlaeota bacterium]